MVSIIVPVFRDWQKLGECLECLRQQTYPRERLQLIVVNNDADGRDVPPGMIRDELLLHEPRPGSYTARNLGLDHARGQIIGFTDADCRPRADWVESAIRLLAGNPGVDRVGGAIELAYRNPARRTAAELYESIFGFNQQGYVDRFGAAATASMFARRKVFDVIGPFNAAMLSGGDLEWGIRAQCAGFAIQFAPDAVVLHPARSDYRDMLQRTRRTAGGRSDVVSSAGAEAGRSNFAGKLRFLRDVLRRVMTSDTTLAQKLTVFAVGVHVLGVAWMERLRLRLGKAPERA
jgi:GT2 family glycosyltransferase